jgi:threonine 3-dehydrogenase
MPAGGTSDYAPEMIHAAAKGTPYASFVRPDTTIPFMTMPDAIRALLGLASAAPETLTRSVYNVTGFSLSAAEIAAQVQQHFPQANITYTSSEGRQKIVDSWPAALDDHSARHDWGWQPDHTELNAFTDYLVPVIRERYA